MDMIEDQLACYMTKAMALHEAPSQKMGSFENLTLRFYGTKSEEALLAFITTVNLYKDFKEISDEVALQELHLLLYGEAAIWWQGEKENIHTWSEALKMLELTFMPRKPAHEIYAAVFAVKQDGHIPTEIFIRQKQALLAELPQPHPENVQMDMIYSLLNSKIKKKIPRESVVSFDQLIRAAKRVEHSKYKKRVKRFEKLDLKALRPVSTSARKCSHCEKSKHFDATGNYCKCHSRRNKRSRRRKESATCVLPQILDCAPLGGFNPDSNPFIK